MAELQSISKGLEMFKKSVFLVLSVAMIGFTAGCGGPGETELVPFEDRPKLNEGKGTKVPGIEQNEDVPDGVLRMD